MRVVGTGTRVLNFLVDIFFILAIAFGMHRGWTFYVFYYGIVFIPLYYFIAGVTFLYYLIFEAIWKRTPGKWISLSKVVTTQDTKPSFFQILARSAIRVVAFIVIDSIFLSFINKTLHDYLSKTEVVEV